MENEKIEKENKKTGKKSKKKVITTIMIIVVLILLIVGGFVFYHANQIGKLVSEVNKMLNIEMVDAEGNAIENPLDMEIKTTGSYAIVERTLKDYVNEVVTETQKLSNAFNEEEIVKLASIDTIEEDGPDFINSKEKIAELRETVNKNKKKWMN